MSLKKYLEHHIKVHTLRIELMDGKILLYKISADVKEDLEKWLTVNVSDLIGSHNVFLSFYSVSDRMVFIKIRSIKRIMFCWDVITQLAEVSSYRDNFGVTFEDEEDTIIPRLIIQLRNNSEPLVYEDLDPNSDFLGIDEQSFQNMHFLKGGFLTVKDEDGEQNYIPMINIECIEVERVYIFPDDMWEEMQNMRNRRNNVN
ncbi:MAG: hypothetical protein ABIN89_28380 [Chitinophagaceae bacterium]